MTLAISRTLNLICLAAIAFLAGYAMGVDRGWDSGYAYCKAQVATELQEGVRDRRNFTLLGIKIYPRKDAGAGVK